MSEGLTEKQKAFADYLLTDPEQNQTKAYLHAYPKCKSEAAARANASKLLTITNIQKYLQDARAKRSERTQIDADWLLTRLADEAEADLADIYYESGALKPIHMWPKIWRQGLVAGVKVRQERNGEDEDFADVVEVKLADRNSIKKMIGDHIGVQAFKQQVEHTHEHKHEALTEEELDARLAKLRGKAGTA